MCCAQTQQTLEGRSVKGGPGEGLCDESYASISKNPADSVRLYWHPCHGSNVSGPGNNIWSCISLPVLPLLEEPFSTIAFSLNVYEVFFLTLKYSYSNTREGCFDDLTKVLTNQSCLMLKVIFVWYKLLCPLRLLWFIRSSNIRRTQRSPRYYTAWVCPSPCSPQSSPKPSWSPCCGRWTCALQPDWREPTLCWPFRKSSLCGGTAAF